MYLFVGHSSISVCVMALYKLTFTYLLTPSSSVLCCRLHIPPAATEANCPYFLFLVSFPGISWSPSSSAALMCPVVPDWQCCHHFCSMCVPVSSTSFFLDHSYTICTYSVCEISWSHPIIDSCMFILTRNSSGDKIANVNFLYDDIVHAVKIQ